MAVPGLTEAAAGAGAILLLALAARFALREPEPFWWLTVAMAPLAVPWRTGLGGVEITVPLEPMLVLSGISLLRARTRPPGGRGPLLRHPALLAAIATLAWMAVASLTAREPSVGLKATVIRSLYAGVLLGGGLAFLRSPTAARRLAVVAAASLLPAGLLALAAHAGTGFDRRAAYEIAQPLFANRLDLIALLTVWAVVGAALLLSRGTGGLSAREGIVVKAFLALAGVLSLTLFARSAVVGVAAALLVLLLLGGRASPRRVVGVMAAGLVVAVLGTVLFASARSARLGLEPRNGFSSPVVDAAPLVRPVSRPLSSREGQPLVDRAPHGRGAAARGVRAERIRARLRAVPAPRRDDGRQLLDRRTGGCPLGVRHRPRRAGRRGTRAPPRAPRHPRRGRREGGAGRRVGGGPVGGRGPHGRARRVRRDEPLQLVPRPGQGRPDLLARLGRDRGVRPGSFQPGAGGFHQSGRLLSLLTSPAGSARWCLPSE